MAAARLLAALPFAFAFAAQAHPGHGVAGGSWSLAHLLGDPLHVGFALAVGLGLAGLAMARRRTRARVRRG
jgi:hypothetical protein